MRLIRVAQFGYGSLGKEIFQTLNENGQFKVVAVIDNDKSKLVRLYLQNQMVR